MRVSHRAGCRQSKICADQLYQKTQRMTQSTSYLKNLEDSLATSREMLELLNNKIAMIDMRIDNYTYHGKDGDKKYVWELNEDKISRIKTQGEIHILQKLIKEKHDYFVKYAQEFDIIKAECDRNYTKLLHQASLEKHHNKPLEQFLATVDFKVIESGIEYKVNFYKRLKTLMNIK